MKYEVAITDIKQNRYLKYNIEWLEISKIKYLIYKYILCYVVRKNVKFIAQ
jgi:hypothetical protein